MALHNWSLLLGLAAMIVYFPLFSRTINTLSPEDQKKFSADGFSIRSALGIAPVFAVFFVEGTYAKAGLALLTCLVLARQSKAHHKQLIERGFSQEFVSRLARVSIVAAVGMTFMLASVILS